MRLLSIQVGKPKKVNWERKPVVTSIFKLPVQGPVRVFHDHLEGDQPADRRFHGGVHKAVYGFSADIYPWWKSELGGKELEWGSFGENLTFETLDEGAIGIGDEFSLGTAVLQAAEPRFPCSKLGVRFRDMGVLKVFIRCARPGIYFRVLQEGHIRAGETLELLRQEPARVSVRDMFQWKFDLNPDPRCLERLLSVPSLSPEWRKKLEKRLKDPSLKTTVKTS